MLAPEFWAREGALPRLLEPLGRAYDLAGRLRRAAAKPWKAPVPVICVGNLVAGGAGKTPVVLGLVRELTTRRVRVNVLTRGYRGREAGPVRVDPRRHDAAAVGDEPLLLARLASTWVSRDRLAGVRAAAAAGAQAIVMDNGFQNPTVRKDLSLLVVDASYGFGNGRVFPAGPLREDAIRGLARADAAVLLGEDEQGMATLLEAHLPMLRAQLAPTSEDGRLAGRKVLAFAGIARPEKFFITLAKQVGAQVVETRSFPDHYRYRPRDIDRLLARAHAQQAVPITTAKDAVRVPERFRGAIEVLEVAVLWQDPEAVKQLIDRAMPVQPTGAGRGP